MQGKRVSPIDFHLVICQNAAMNYRFCFFLAALLIVSSGCATNHQFEDEPTPKNPFRTGNPYRYWDNERAPIDAN